MEKIAIVGISCLFPGATTPAEYWQNLVTQTDSRSQATEAQMGVDPAIFHAEKKGVLDRFYCATGGYVSNFAFDPAGYQLPATQISAMDELFQWSLYVADQALRDAGVSADKSELLARTGVVLGNLSFPTRKSHGLFEAFYRNELDKTLSELLDDNPIELPRLGDGLTTDNHNLKIAGYPAAFICDALGLGGTNFALDAACASSLYAVKMASQQLLSGKADMMLAGAVSCADPLFINMGFSIFHAYPEGNEGSAPLNAVSNGLNAGEGAGMFVLKRHSDAVRDGNNIYAVIGGVGLSNDGKGRFLLQPNPKGQVLAFERAYAEADLNPAEVDYVECHATGTPIGDITELNSMEAFYGQHNAAPPIGSAKSNFGHLLTAAGMAGMTKVILSMANDQIPATIGLTDPLVSKGGTIGGANVVDKTSTWPKQGKVARAAVSAFGFGGTNAHLILEEATTQPTTQQPRTNQLTTKLAITGMDAFFGSCDGLEAFGSAIYEGKADFRPIPQGRWLGLENNPELLKQHGFEDGVAPAGSYIDSYELDYFYFKIPPNGDTPIPQQSLMLKVADRAIKDANLAAGSNVAVIIGMGVELQLHRYRGRVDLTWQLREALEAGGFDLTAEQLATLEQIAKDAIHAPTQINQYTSFIGNIMASRISSLWDFSGPSFTISAEENSTFKALEVAQMMLAAGEVDAVVVGAVDLAGSAENVLSRSRSAQLSSAKPSLSLNAGSGGWLVGEGAGCVVVKRAADAEQERTYAVIEDVSLASGNGLQTAAQQSFTATGIRSEQVGYVELFGSGNEADDSAEIKTLTTLYQGKTPSTAIGSVKSTHGHTFAASGIASLIKSALCLHQRFLPATPNWDGPADARLRQSALFVPTEAQPWLLTEGQSKRLATVHGFGADGAAAHLLLSGKPVPTDERNAILKNKPFHLFPLGVSGVTEVADALTGLRDLLESAKTIRDAANQNFAAFKQQAFCIALVAHNADELRREIEMARVGIPKAFASGAEWKTPLGSYFTPQPLGKSGKVTFVYPGAFSAYPGLGRELFQLFPELYETFADVYGNSAELINSAALYPRNIDRQNEMQQALQAMMLMEDSIGVLVGGATYSTLITQVLRDTFGIKPDAALGYSLGEMTMMFATGVWSVADNNIETLKASPVFNSRLSHKHEAVREFWNLPSADEDKTPVWAIYLLKISAEIAKPIIENYDRVYLTHINTASEIVIAGDPTQCAAAVEKLGCKAIKAPYSHVIHCEPMRSEYDNLMPLNTVPVTNQPPIDFYFAAQSNKTPLESTQIAHNISTSTTQQVDFPALIQRAYDDGARLFVELGPRSACTWWIKEILQNQPHVAVGLNRRSKDDHTMLLLALAQLASHGVEVDLTRLYDAVAEQTRKTPSLIRTVSLLQTPIREAILTPENRALFADVKVNKPEPIQQPLVVEKRERVVANSAENKPTGIPTLVLPPPNLPKPQQTMNPKQSIQPPTQPPAPPAANGNGHNADESFAEMPAPQPAESDFMLQQLQALTDNRSATAEVHEAFLQMRATAMAQIAQLLTSVPEDGAAPALAPRVIVDAEPSLPPKTPVDPRSKKPGPQRHIADEQRNRPNNYLVHGDIIWDRPDLIEYAGGSIVPMFGEEFRIIDSYRRRVRLPMYPYLLVDRITALEGETHKYEPSFMRTEYDIPFDAWYSTDGQVSWAVSVESGQCDLLLISYLGIDFQAKGDRVYRLLDCTLTFLDDMPMEGSTLRYDISINSFARNGDALLFFFSYDCYVGDKMVLKMRNGCAGFFTDDELAAGKGIIHTQRELAEKAAIPKQYFEPPLVCNQTTFDRSDLATLSDGNVATIFGREYLPYSKAAGRNPSLHMPPEAILMIDKITKIDPHGGAWGLGIIEAELNLEPNDWYFPCHFKDDEVLAGSLVAEGCCQLMQFYLLYLGMQSHTVDARFQPIRNLGQVVRTRKQIMASKETLTYRLEITEIGLDPTPYAKANVDIIYKDTVCVDFKNLGLQLKEKSADDPFSVSSSQYSVDSKSTDHRLLTTDYRLSPALVDDWQIKNFATGSISACFGEDYKIFEGKRIPRTPNGDLQLFHRVVEIDAERGQFSGKPSITSEYDVPVDAWYFTQNSYHTMPYSVLMEIALQPCGFLSAQVGSTLPYPDTDFFFRNLDGDGHLLRDFDLRGQTIRNRVTLLSSTAMPGIVIQKFEFEMSVKGEAFYVGTAVFGYFEGASLVNQVGLDQGNPFPNWLQESGAQGKTIDLTNDREMFNRASTYCLGDQQLDFLDTATVTINGGRNGKGHVFAQKTIDPNDWFFTCHFYQDPVMPGSLGVEAIVQAMQIYALQADLGAELRHPHFAQVDDHKVVWMYRGQMTPESGVMNLEVDITAVERSGNQVVVKGDASLWKNDLRIYHVKDMAIRLVSS